MPGEVHGPSSPVWSVWHGRYDNSLAVCLQRTAPEGAAKAPRLLARCGCGPTTVQELGAFSVDEPCRRVVNVGRAAVRLVPNFAVPECATRLAAWTLSSFLLTQAVRS